jgi:hypothetical protein
MMDVRHYYHVHAAGAWSEPVREHAAALGESGFRGHVTVGMTGPPLDRARAREMITIRFADAGLLVARWLEEDKGFEQLTLQQVYYDVHQIPGEFAVLYAHTKGAYDSTEFNALWRRSMTRHVVSVWGSNAKLLEGRYDAVGCHWLTPKKHHQPERGRPVTTPMFGGNFWMARASYLRRLPPPGTEYRHQAEEWVGLGDPKVRDLRPGWPSKRLFK